MNETTIWSFIDDIKTIADYHNLPVTATAINVYTDGYMIKVEQHDSADMITITNQDTGCILYKKDFTDYDDMCIFIRRLKSYLEFVRNNGKGPGEEDLIEWLINDIDTSDYYKDIFKKFESDISELHIKWDKYLEELK